MLWMGTNDWLAGWLMIINCSGSAQVVVGRKFQQLSHQTGVTLATQTSVERLHWLVETSDTWDGPMSVVVFVPDAEFDLAQLYISYLRSCFSKIRDNVAWSLAHPVTKPPRAANLEAGSLSCTTMAGRVSRHMPAPSTPMANAACRLSCFTSFTLSL